MTVWCMNLKDNRGGPKQNRDKELKFRLCLEKSMVAIGWAIPDTVNTWEEYRKKAKEIWAGNEGYLTAATNLQDMKKGDLVWVRNPTGRTLYLVEIIDDVPGIYSSLKEFDICGYRKGEFYLVGEEQLTDELRDGNLRARGTLERMHEDTRGDIRIATVKLFHALKAQANPVRTPVKKEKGP